MSLYLFFLQHFHPTESCVPQRLQADAQGGERQGHMGRSSAFCAFSAQ